ncbi:microtubule-associated serine/threonine-protein kinase 2 isoform X5 [Tachysurus ichikawai]
MKKRKERAGAPNLHIQIWPTAQFRCHGNSSLLQHLLSPTSFSSSSSSSLSPLRLLQGVGPEEAVCAPGPASAPALGLSSPNPFFWR